jgi:hypothetical protein
MKKSTKAFYVLLGYIIVCFSGTFGFAKQLNEEELRLFLDGIIYRNMARWPGHWIFWGAFMLVILIILSIWCAHTTREENRN